MTVTQQLMITLLNPVSGPWARPYPENPTVSELLDRTKPLTSLLSNRNTPQALQAVTKTLTVKVDW
jgi:hypothetical protein